MLVQQFNILLGLLVLLTGFSGMNLILKVVKTFELYMWVMERLVLPQVYVHLDNYCYKICEKDPINLHIYSTSDLSRNRLNIIKMMY
jgi:hypothetical protein